LNDQIQLEITCRQVWKQVSEYLDGNVPLALRERLERHFSNCHHCRAIMDGARNTVTLVADERAFELPPETSRRLYAKLSDLIFRK
jgi:predicted anti-sigma-YlaC factor YlaD